MIPPASRRPPSPARRFLILGLVSLLLGTGYAVAVWRTRASDSESGVLAAATESKESFAEVRPFSLVDSRGLTVTRETLLGRPWIVGFVFTRCTGPCPRVTANMRKIQDMVKDTDVRIVTISVDPEYDTPAVLTEYAAKVGADLDRWTFLTGPLADVKEVSVKSFLSPIEKDSALPVGESIIHRTYLTVVDKQGRVRGYYDGEGDAGIARAVARAKFLSHEASRP